MGHGKATFKQADLTRALRAVEKAGRDLVRAEIARDGRIVLVFKNGEEVLVERNEWDEMARIKLKYVNGFANRES